jgi:hypothetical protein
VLIPGSLGMTKQQMNEYQQIDVVDPFKPIANR